MKQFSLLLLFFIVVACAPMRATSSAPTDLIPPTETSMPPTSTSQRKILDAFAARAALGRGVNMGNMLEAPREGEWGVYIQEKYFDAIKAAGFDSVRIPIRWNAHAAAAAPYAVDASFFVRVDQVVGWALARGLTVIVDFHHYEEMMTDPNGHHERYLAIWRQVAEHYKDQPANVLFELLNEPNSAQDVSTWNNLLPQALAVVRESNPTRNVIIGPTQWNSASMIETLQLPADDTHIIATFHYYEPFHFTHQGAQWVQGADAWLGTTWDATDSQKNEIANQFDRVAAWAKANNRPILLGEFGAYSKGDPASRVRWTSFVAREAEKRDFAWAYWEFCAGFGVYDPNTDTWREDLLKALIP